MKGVQQLKIEEIIKILDASVLAGAGQLEEEVTSACSADMMSDVLAFSKDHSALLTGLCNTQVIRTAEMMDIGCIIIVRGKKPTDEMIAMAKERSIVLLSTPLLMFSASGLLYQNKIIGGDI